MTAYDAWTLFEELYQSATIPNLLDHPLPEFAPPVTTLTDLDGQARELDFHLRTL